MITRTLNFTVLAVFLTIFCSATASAAVRYASPTGTAPAGGTCIALNPCSLLDAIHNSYINDGDEVILAPGDYLMGPSDQPYVSDAVHVHGQGAPWQTRILTQANYGFSLANAGAKLSQVQIEQSAGIAFGVSISPGGTLERAIVRSSSASAAYATGGTIRDSILSSSSAGGAGLSINTGGGPYTVTLRNSTFVGNGPSNSYGIYAGMGSGSLTIDALGVIARGVNRDILASGSGGGSVTVTLNYSNFSNTLAVGTSTITSSGVNSNQSTAPTFLNPANDDFHQASGSATINVGGVDGSSGSTDVDGDSRAIGVTDIGGDEYQPTAPAVPVIETDDGLLTGDTTPLLMGTAAGGTFVTIYRGGADYGTVPTDLYGNWSYEFPVPLPDGTHSITASAANASGSASAQTSAISIETDSTDPIVSISAPADGAITSDTTPQLSFSVTEANPDQSTCQINSSPTFNCTSGASPSSPLPDGDYTLTVAHNDQVGNVGNDVVDFTIDATNPVVDVASPAAGSFTSDATPQITFTATDANAGSTTCSVDGGTPFACATGDSLPALGDGAHTLAVAHTDDASNAGSSTVGFTVDTVAPVVTISSPAADGSGVTTNAPQFTFGVTDANPGQTTCSLDGAAPAACASPLTLSALSDGAHSLVVGHTDLAGNAGSATRTITVDATAPQTTVKKKPKSKSKSRKAKFSFASSEPGSTFECKLDRGAYKPCKASHSVKVKRGKHTLRVRAKDALGNVDATPATIRWRVK